MKGPGTAGRRRDGVHLGPGGRTKSVQHSDQIELDLEFSGEFSILISEEVAACFQFQLFYLFLLSWLLFIPVSESVRARDLKTDAG